MPGFRPFQRTAANFRTDPFREAIEDFPIVAIGASAGGLEACSRFLRSLSPGTGVACIFVLHLAPNQESLMVELLASHTHMVAQQAVDGMPIEPEHLYVIPPGANLSVKKGRLHLSRLEPKRGARLPFDYLLHSVAEEYGQRAIAIVLSGTGADGSQGIKAIKQKGGLVIAQDPAEAASTGMPESAIATGLVDLAMPVDKMWQALMDRKEQLAEEQTEERGDDQVWLSSIIDILRAKTPHDFTLYKTGTLHRRIERRMSQAGIEPQNRERYVDLLRKDAREVSDLAQEILINVTSFFRDPKIFEFLAEKIMPDLVRHHPPDRPFCIWVAGCSTGEETYSLAILFREACQAADRQIKLQIFASDVDPDAIANAREGLYPPAIETEVSSARLKRFFDKEGGAYRIASDLRGSVVFTVQDVLADPPFSRLDFISCRNLLIYLRPEAQNRVIGLFDFALLDSGTLLLGSSETILNPAGRFEIISKPARLYRHIGVGKLRDIDFPMNSGEGVRVPSRIGPVASLSRQGSLADLCRRMVMDTYAPAAVLINREYQCLYSLGPTERYLRVAPGHPTHDLLSMARESVRIKLRIAIQQASQDNTRVLVSGGQVAAGSKPFNIDIQPVKYDGEDLLLVCFIDAADGKPNPIAAALPEDISKIAALEHELAATRAELQGAIRNLQTSNEEQKAINEEARSVNEEYQSANEELLTSKEELQSLNEELTVLNSQLQETLDRQRTTANDLQNVLYSTDVATLFLDTDFRIRFFTPATQTLFNILPGDIGRPISDLNLLTAETDLIPDVQHVLQTQRLCRET
jgi:two-component system CheB/CheR fusion protein